MNVDFSALVKMYYTQGLISLGKLNNPITGNLDKSLDQAKLLIDILSIFEKKTEGNLTDVERRLLEDSLQNLRLNFVYELDMLFKHDKEN